jgi:hypothetical protein
MNVEIGTAAAQFPVWKYINAIFVAVYIGTPVHELIIPTESFRGSLEIAALFLKSMYISCYIFLPVDKDEE